jgi:hypothetical protein
MGDFDRLAKDGPPGGALAHQSVANHRRRQQRIEDIDAFEPRTNVLCRSLTRVPREDIAGAGAE